MRASYDSANSPGWEKIGVKAPLQDLNLNNWGESSPQRFKYMAVAIVTTTHHLHCARGLVDAMGRHLHHPRPGFGSELLVTCLQSHSWCGSHAENPPFSCGREEPPTSHAEPSGSTSTSGQGHALPVQPPSRQGLTRVARGPGYSSLLRNSLQSWLRLGHVCMLL